VLGGCYNESASAGFQNPIRQAGSVSATTAIISDLTTVGRSDFQSQAAAITQRRFIESPFLIATTGKSTRLPPIPRTTYASCRVPGVLKQSNIKRKK
jgi:hypothetical protein